MKCCPEILKPGYVLGLNSYLVHSLYNKSFVAVGHQATQKHRDDFTEVSEERDETVYEGTEEMGDDESICLVSKRSSPS